MKKKIGIMGGTFDPIHIGHLMLGEKAYEQYGLDQIWFMPAGNPPHKQHREGRATDRQRVEMIRLAIQGNSHFSLSLEDMQTEGYSYTYRMLERLQEEHPDTEFYFIIGGDSLRDFDTWRKPERICRIAHLLVAKRDHIEQEELSLRMEKLTAMFHGHFSLLDVPKIEISSRMLREWIEQGNSVQYYVPDNVNTYIQEQKLYQR